MNKEFEISILNCNSHNSLIKQLSPLFRLKRNDKISVRINLKSRFVYPDFLILIVSCIKHIDNIGVDIRGTIEYSENLAVYISRMNFFEQLGFTYNENYIRHSSHGIFVEITSFNEENIHIVEKKVMTVLREQTNTSENVLKVLDYCLYEVMDNVVNHSEVSEGWVVAQYYSKSRKIRLMICDTGIGIYKSLMSSEKYKNITPDEALEKCVVNSVTNGKGMGFGLFATSNFIAKNKGKMYIHSDDYRLSIIGETKKVEKKDFWNGTAVFMEIDCDIDVNPEEISEGKTYLFDMYNEYYDDNIDDLW